MSIARGFLQSHMLDKGNFLTTMVFPTEGQFFFIPAMIGPATAFYKITPFPTEIVVNHVAIGRPYEVSDTRNLCRMFGDNHISKITYIQKGGRTTYYIGRGGLFAEDGSPLMLTGFECHTVFAEASRKLLIDISVLTRKDNVSKFIIQKIAPALSTEGFPRTGSLGGPVKVEILDLSAFKHETKNPKPDNIESCIRDIILKHKNKIIETIV